MGFQERRGAAPPHLPAKGREAFGNHDFWSHLFSRKLSVCSAHLETESGRALYK
jgi:hypothetical protein